MAGQNFPDILKSRTLAEKVIKNLSLHQILKKRNKNLKKWKLIEKMQKTIKVEDNKKGLIKVSFEDRNPKLAAKIVNEYINQLDKFNKKSMLTIAKKQRIFIEKRIKETEAKLKSSEEKLKDFQQKNKFVSLDKESEAIITYLSDLKAKKAEVEVSLKGIEEETYSAKEKLDNTARTQISAKTITENPVVSGLKQELANLEIQLNQSLLTLKEDHPDVVILKDKIKKTKDKIKKEVEKVVSAQEITVNPIYQQLQADIIEKEIEQMGLIAKENALNKITSQMEEKIANIPGKGLEYARLLRETKIQESIYTLFHQELEKAKIQEKKEEPTFQILDKAIPPKIKFKPKIKLNVAISGILSIFIGIFLVFFLEYLESIKKKEEKVE
jgi:uncharacterized protein involved in exopolysaccharide biosynthesis